MPRTKTTPPGQSRQKGQRSLQLPDYLVRVLPPWKSPEWAEANAWRNAVAAQPFANVCRDTLISNIMTMDWKLEPKDSTQRDELKEDMDYYTDFFLNSGEYDYLDVVDWVCSDALDIPFGAGVELGWQGDTSAKVNPNSRLMWIELLDGATLFPTLDSKYPVGQYIPEALTSAVYFPKHAINRMYYSPRREIRRKGWGIAPPQKIYLALEMLSRGDAYYANLLIDTPEVGILDLGDISEESAVEWIKSWRDLLGGIDPFKIPVLYGHEKTAEFISFTRSPTELLYDRTLLKYHSLVAAGYGMSLSDVGIQAASSGGETLAGSIRQERRTKRTGFGRLKSKVNSFYNNMLPETLRFQFIDLDDEFSVALGRARLATITAITQAIQSGVLTPSEGRQQFIADGLITISIPEEIDESELEQGLLMGGNGNAPERPGMLGKPVPASSGGQGEILPRADLFDMMMEEVPEFREVVEDIDKKWDKLNMNKKSEILDELQSMLSVDVESVSVLDT